MRVFVLRGLLTPVRARAAWLVLVTALGCGPTTAAATRTEQVSNHAGSSVPTELRGARKRLQGTWEIVRYQSDRPIPKEAMPLMGEMFDALRVRFDGAKATFEIGKNREQLQFDIADEQDSEFRLVAQGGMFDGALCKFVADDEWQVVDKGDKWPGVSTLKRVGQAQP